MPSRLSSFRIAVALGGLGAVLTVAVAWVRRVPQDRPGQVARWFAPGLGGYESGAPVPPPSVSAYLTRHIGGLSSPDAAAWARHNGLTPPLSFMHNLGDVFPPNLFSTHPDYFPWVAGKRLQPKAGSPSWNPDLGRADVALHAATMARHAFLEDPGRVSFALGVNDGLVFGESAETLAAVTPPRWFRGRPDYSNLVFGFMNRAAADLARTHPDKYLGALAYYWAENTPDFPVHPQVLPFLTADRSQGYDAAFWREEFALQERWGRAGSRRMGLYDYLDGIGFVIPRIHPHLIATSLAHARRSGFSDYFAEASPNWGIDGPMTWLVAQLLSDPQQNAEVLLDEYYERYFQEATEPMRRFFTRCEAQWLGQAGPSYWLKHYRNESQADLFPLAVCAELRQMLDEAGRLARQNKIGVRVAFVAEAFGVTERFVRLNEVRASLSRATVTGGLAGRVGASLLGAYLAARANYIGYSQELTARQPLAFSPILYEDFLRNDPTMAATALLAARQGRNSKGSDAASAAVLGMLRGRSEAGVAAGLAFARAAQSAGIASLLSDGGFEGPRRPGKRIAGLSYGIDLPGAWQSMVEPTESHAAEVNQAASRTGAGGLRISGAVNTTVYQWLPAKAGRVYVAGVHSRGRVSSSNAVFLTFGWLDAEGRHLGKSLAARLPDGSWPDWVELQQGALAPPGTVWVGIGIHLQSQLPGDWAEFDDFSLSEVGVAQ